MYMYFNDVNFALGLMFAAFSDAGSATSGCAPEVFHSRVFHSRVFRISNRIVVAYRNLGVK